MVTRQKSTEWTEATLLDLEDEFLANIVVNGKPRSRRIKRKNAGLGLGTAEVPINEGITLISAGEHLGRMLNINNTAGEVTLLLPSFNAFGSWRGPIFWARIRGGDFPVKIQVAVDDEMRTPRPNTTAASDNIVFIGSSTANADENVFCMLKVGGFWVPWAPMGVRLGAGDDTSGGVSGAEGTLTAKDEGVTLSETVSSINVVGSAVSAAMDELISGQLNVFVSPTAFGETTLTFADPLTWDVDAAPNASLTMTGNCTINVINAQAGGRYALVVIQDAAGGHDLTFGTGFADTATIDQNIDAVTILNFYGHESELHNADNVGDGLSIVDLAAAAVIVAADDVFIMERLSDGEPLKATALQIQGAITAPIDEPDDRELTDDLHNRVIELDGAAAEVTVPAALTAGFFVTLVNKSGGNITIVGDGITVAGDLTLGDDHFATIYRGLTEALSRVSG